MDVGNRKWTTLGNRTGICSSERVLGEFVKHSMVCRKASWIRYVVGRVERFGERDVRVEAFEVGEETWG